MTSNAMVSYVRLYADAGGDSHFEDVAVATVPFESVDGIPPLGLAGPLPGGELFILHVPPEQGEDDWHNAPRRQWVVQLIGATEVETSDGEVRCFGPAALVLAEDTAGKDHRTRSVNEGDNLLLMIPTPHATGET